MTTNSRRSLYPAIFLGFAALCFAGLSPYLFVADARARLIYNTILLLLFNLGAALLLFAAARRTAPDAPGLGQAWLIVALAQLLRFAGDLSFAVLEVALNQPAFPSFADGFFLLYYPVFLAGIMKMPGRMPWHRRHLYTGLQAVIVSLSAALYLWFFVISPLMLQKAIDDPWQPVFFVTYPVLDLVTLMVGLLLILRRDTRVNPTTLSFLIAGRLAMALVDTLFGYQALQGLYTPGNWLDAGYQLAYLLVALAGLSQCLYPRERPAPPASNSPQADGRITGLVRSLLPTLWLVALFILLTAGPRLPGVSSHRDLILWTTVILGLAVLLQITSAADNARLSADLRRLNEELEVRVDDRTRDLTVEIGRREQITGQLRVSHELYRAMVEDIPVLISRFLPGGILTYVNRAYCDYFQKTPEELIGTSFLESIPSGDREYVDRQIRALTRENSVLNFEHRVTTPDGRIRWQRWIDRAVFNEDQLLEYQSIGMDTTEQHLVEQALRESEEKFRDLFDNSSDLIQLVSPEGRIIFVNNTWKKKLGYSSQELEQLSLWNILDPNCQVHCQADFERVLAGESVDDAQAVFVSRAGQPVYLEGNLNCSMNNGIPAYIRCIFHDVSDRRKSQELLIQQAYHDALTGLPNRATLVTRLRRAIEAADGDDGYHCALLFLDLDNFKVVNDSLGHTIGDELLVAVGKRLAHCVRSEDLVARLGGDEFVILLEGIDSDSYVLSVAERVREELRQPIVLHQHPVTVSVSMGIVTHEYIQDADGALRDADIAMYSAKSLGKDRFVLFEPDMRAKPAERLSLQNDMRAALERDEFFLVYQPVMHLKTNQMRGAEVLLRWRHPVRGLLMPGEFIQVAEEAGLIVPIGTWVLRQACRQMKIWIDDYPTARKAVVSVNVSIKQLTHPGFLDVVRQALDESGLEPGCLALELTEGVVMENIHQAGEILHDIHRMGIQIYIDDFGTGYSSLERLQHLPIQVIKIDRNFLAQMREDGGNAEVLRAIVVLGHELGLVIIAEGIEKAYQSQYLQQLGCALGQGYLLSRPLTVTELELSVASDHLILAKS